jgi:pyruvate dehydrogenase E1 component beta subunit
MRKLNMADAIREGIWQAMEADPSVILIGEDVGKFGGAFHLTHGLLAEFGPNRVWDAPISEAGYTGVGIGASLTGLRPIVEYQYLDFILRWTRLSTKHPRSGSCLVGKPVSPLYFAALRGLPDGQPSTHRVSRLGSCTHLA